MKCDRCRIDVPYKGIAYCAACRGMCHICSLPAKPSSGLCEVHEPVYAHTQKGWTLRGNPGAPLPPPVWKNGKLSGLDIPTQPEPVCRSCFTEITASENMQILAGPHHGPVHTRCWVRYCEEGAAAFFAVLAEICETWARALHIEEEQLAEEFGEHYGKSSPIVPWNAPHRYPIEPYDWRAMARLPPRRT